MSSYEHRPHTPERVLQLLEAIAGEASVANAVIALGRDDDGSGRVKVATAMHRIEKWADEAMGIARGAA